MIRLLFLALIGIISCGCRDQGDVDLAQSSAAKPRAAVKLTVLVIDDAELAKAIDLLAGEWNERSSGELTVTQTSLDEMLAGSNIAADVVIYPSRHLGSLVMRDWIRPVRQSALDDANLAWGDILTALRDQVVRYGGQVYALPLGDMPLVMAWRGDVPDRLPTMWSQVGDSGTRSTSAEVTSFPLVAELLARSLAKTNPVDRATTFFDVQTLNAKLDHPPIVRALKEMQGADGPSGYSAAVCLPRGTDAERFSTLLRDKEIYNDSLDQWESGDDAPPPVILGFSGRLVSVTTASRNAASAFKLLPWLVSGGTGAKLSQQSTATLWFRPSQVPHANQWLLDNAETAQMIAEMLSRGETYLLPRVPGIDRYLSELESGLRQVIDGEVSVAEALAAIESRWNLLTDELGRQQQQTAFRLHLGLGE